MQVAAVLLRAFSSTVRATPNGRRARVGVSEGTSVATETIASRAWAAGARALGDGDRAVWSHCGGEIPHEWTCLLLRWRNGARPSCVRPFPFCRRARRAPASASQMARSSPSPALAGLHRRRGSVGGSRVVVLAHPCRNPRYPVHLAGGRGRSRAARGAGRGHPGVRDADPGRRAGAGRRGLFADLLRALQICSAKAPRWPGRRFRSARE